MFTKSLAVHGRITTNDRRDNLVGQSHKEALEIQIREAYGRLVYTYTTHLKQAEQLTIKNQGIKHWQIILSAVTTGGILTAVISDQTVLSWISAIVSTVLLGLNLYIKDFNLADEIRRHYSTSDDLWIIREKYVSLLTDFDTLCEQEIVNIRDKLQEQTAEIYKSAPKTNTKSYMAAQKALKEAEEQFFRSSEIDQILPEHLRKGTPEN